MSLSDKKSNIMRHLKNIPGWRSNRKIVVIDSDDWGSIRMPSRKIYNKLLGLGIDVNGGDGLRFSLYDTIASVPDLEALYEVLTSFKDKNNAPAVMTANSVVANPDFDKIKETDFREYHFESFTETVKRYYGTEDIFKLWKEGIDHRVFVPQFHGREHLNVDLWMNALRAGDIETILAFNEGAWAFVPQYYNNTGLEYEAAFQLSEISMLEHSVQIIKDGVALFEKLFGYKAKYFVPPNGRVNNELNYTCYNNGLIYRSAPLVQQESLKNGKTKKVFHWLGQSDKNGVKYIIRNCVFEPSKPGKDWVDSCLADINMAFKYGKPAVISTHRVNFIGVHDISNRDKGLKQLKSLLTAVVNKWPDVEFMSSDQLGDLIAGE